MSQKNKNNKNPFFSPNPQSLPNSQNPPSSDPVDPTNVPPPSSPPPNFNPPSPVSPSDTLPTWKKDLLGDSPEEFKEESNKRNIRENVINLREIKKDTTEKVPSQNIFNLKEDLSKEDAGSNREKKKRELVSIIKRAQNKVKDKVRSSFKDISTGVPERKRDLLGEDEKSPEQPAEQKSEEQKKEEVNLSNIKKDSQKKVQEIDRLREQILEKRIQNAQSNNDFYLKAEKSKVENSQKIIKIVAIAGLVIIVGIIIYFWMRDDVPKEEEEGTTGTEEVFVTSEEEAKEACNCTDDFSDNLGIRPVYLQPKEGWRQYFSGGGETILRGKTREEVVGFLGEASIIVRDLSSNPHKEVWTYLIQDGENSQMALYIYFLQDKVIRGQESDFKGLSDKCEMIGF